MCACMLFGKHVLLLRVTRDKEEEEEEDEEEEEEEDTEVSPSSRASRCERAAISISKHVFSSFPRSHHCGLHQPLSHSRERECPLIFSSDRSTRETKARETNEREKRAACTPSLLRAADTGARSDRARIYHQRSRRRSRRRARDIICCCSARFMYLFPSSSIPPGGCARGHYLLSENRAKRGASET